MNYKPLAFIAIGVVAGLSIASLFNREDKTNSITGTPAPTTTVAGKSRSDDDEKDQRIAALTEELEATKRKLAEDSQARGKRQAEEFLAMMARQQKGIRAALSQREIDSLIKAGFSPERVEWAKHRTEELLVKQQRERDERKAKGIAPDPFKTMAYMLDSDLDLRLEMGDDEYERYRRALGRPDGVEVTSVLSTSNAEIAGLRAGDEILSYDGKRTYNQGMLDQLTAARTSAAPALVEVRRNGQTLLLSIPKGRIGIRN